MALTIYHHTSTLRTNLIWMAGVIEVEGKGRPALHPQLGEIRNDARVRRALKDFPPLVWFTSRTRVPGVLKEMALHFVDKAGQTTEVRLSAKESAVISLNRVALGFDAAMIGAVKWQDYPGYYTQEGGELNETAREAGDDPNDWYITDKPVDLLSVTEFWSSSSMFKQKLERVDRYVAEIKKMVTLCRTTKGVYIPPTWLPHDKARALAATMNMPVAET